MRPFIIVTMLFLSACGQSQEEKQNIAKVTCSIMAETRNMDGAIRVEKLNDARMKIGGEPFLDGDDAIKLSLTFGLCELLVLNDPEYDSVISERIAEAAALKKKHYDEIMAEAAARQKKKEESRISAPRSADEVVTAHCGACHSSGVLGAPRIGDRAHWQARAEARGGVDGLLKSVIAGFNAMPPKGTCSTCTDDELLSAIKKMSGLQ